MSRRVEYIPEPSRFSRPWWIETVKTAAWVVVVTLLIWVYADMEFTDEAEFTGTIHVTTAGNPDLVLLTLDEQRLPRRAKELDVRFGMVLRGARASLDAFRTALNAALRDPQRLELDISRRMVADEATYVLKEAEVVELLNKAVGVSDRGLTMVSLTVPDRTIHIETWTWREIPVRLRVPEDMLVKPPQLEPRTVEIRVYPSLWRRMLTTWQADPARAGEPYLEAVTDLRALRESDAEPIEARVLDPMPGVDVPVRPETVRATVEVRTDSIKLPVIVRVQTPHTWTTDRTWEQYQLEVDDDFWWRQEITVSGTRKDIEAIRQREQDISAWIVLTEDDKGAGFSRRHMQIRFPEDVDVQLVGDPPSFQVRLVKRPTP
jgi:hypothetical protein